MENKYPPPTINFTRTPIIPMQMNRRKSRFSRPVKITQSKTNVETSSDEEDQYRREEQLPPPVNEKFRINPADTPITPPLTPPRHGSVPGKAALLVASTGANKASPPQPPQQEEVTSHVLTVLPPPEPPPPPPTPAPVDELARTVRMLLTIPPPPPPPTPSVPPPPLPPPVVPSRQLNRLPPAPGTRYGAPNELPSLEPTASAHPPLLEEQQQHPGTAVSQLAAWGPPLYPPPSLNCTVSEPSHLGRNSQEQHPQHQQQSGAPYNFPNNFQIDLSVPPPPVVKTYNIPTVLVTALRQAVDKLYFSYSQNSSTSNVAQPNMSHSQEQTQITPPMYPPETQVSQLNTKPPFHLTTSQPPMPVHNFSPHDVSQPNGSHNLMPLHHFTQPNVPISKPPHMHQHQTSAHHTAHSHIPTYHHYPPITAFSHMPQTDVPPTHGKSPHNAPQYQSHSRRITEHSTPHHSALNTETQLYMAGSYKNSSSDSAFTHCENTDHTPHGAHGGENNPWYKSEDCEATGITTSHPGLQNLWVPPPLQTPRSRPPPLPPPVPPPPQHVESSNQTPLSHLHAMPTPPPDQHDKALSPGTMNFYSGHGHHYQNYQGHQQYWNQQNKSSPPTITEYHQPQYTDTRSATDTTISRWSQDVPHRLARYHVPTLPRPEINGSTMQMDYDFRSSHRGRRARTRGRGSHRGRNTYSNRLLRQLTSEKHNEEWTVAHRQHHRKVEEKMFEKGMDVCALLSACTAVQRTMGGASAPIKISVPNSGGGSPTGTPELPAPPPKQILPALMALPWASNVTTSAIQGDDEEGSAEKRLCIDPRKKDEPVTGVSDQLAVPFTNPVIQNGDSATTSQYQTFLKKYMLGSFGDALHAHQGQSSLSAPPKDPQTKLLPSTGQTIDITAKEMYSGLLSSGGRLILPDPYPTVAPYLALQRTPEDKEKFMKSFWASVYQQQLLQLGLLPMLQPNLRSEGQVGTHLYQQMMGHKEFRNALAELDHQILARGSLGSDMPRAALPPAPSIHSSMGNNTNGSAMILYTKSGTSGTSPSDQSDVRRSALQDTHSSAQTAALPACCNSGCCNNVNSKTSKKEQQKKELEQLKLFQKQQLQRKMEGMRLMNEETLRLTNEQLQQQQQRKNEKDKMKQLNKELQKQAIQAHIEQQGQQPQYTQQAKKNVAQIQDQTKEAYALKNAFCVPFLQQHINEHGMIRESQHSETKPHQDVNLQLKNVNAKRGRKRKSEPLEQESAMQRALNLEEHRASQKTSVEGVQRSVIVHGKEYVNQMSEFTNQQQFHYVDNAVMKSSKRKLSEQVKQVQQPKMPQLTQLLMQGQSEMYHKANAQKQKEALRSSNLAAEQIITEPRKRKQSEMSHSILNKKALHMENLFNDLHVKQKISEYIKQEPISSPTEVTVIKAKEEQEDRLNMWCGGAVNTERVAVDLQQAQLRADLQRKPLSFSHHDTASSELVDDNQGLDLSCQKHVQKLVCDNITIKTEESAEEICDQATNQQTQETFDLLEELDEIKLDTLQQQNTDQQQNLLELPSFGSYLNVDGMEEADVEEADLNAAYHAVVSLQQSEIPDVPATPPSHITRTSDYCQSPTNGSTVSNLSRMTKQSNEDCSSSKVVQQVPSVQMPQRSRSPVAVQMKANTEIKGPKMQHKNLWRSRLALESGGDTVSMSDCALITKCDSAREVISTFDETSHSQPVSSYDSAYRHTYTAPEAVTDAAMDTVPVGVNSRSAPLKARTSRNSRTVMKAPGKATLGITPASSLTVSTKVATSSEAQAILQGASTDSTSATDMTITSTAFGTSDMALPSLQDQRTRRTVKRKCSRQQSKK